MGIEQNYNNNLKKSTKKQMSTLPPNSKFIFQQLLKNSHHIEENLENETMVEYNIGDLKGVIKNILSEKKLLNEAKPCCTKYCWFSPKLGDACDGGDGHKGGRWSNTVNGCACSYDKTDDGWDVGGKYVSGGIDKDLSSNDVEVEMGEATTTASSGSYETPKFWAKGKKNHRFATKRWMPDSKYVKVKDKCKKFPYCNQGDINALEIWEKSIMRESAKNVAKKTGKSESEVREMIENEIAEIIRRSFYKSPVTDLVGGGKMNTPIGKIFTMSGNKPKYES